MDSTAKLTRKAKYAGDFIVRPFFLRPHVSFVVLYCVFFSEVAYLV
jgi:hypothetical protein